MPRHAVLGSVLALLLLLVLVLVPHGLGPDVGRALVALRAKPVLVCVGCAMFVISLLCSAGAWRTTVAACGGCVEMDDAASFYGVGSLTSSLLPARAGDGVRVALFSRTLPPEGRLWTMGGVLLAISVARAAALLGLFVAAAALGELPLWPLAVLGGVLVFATALAMRVRRTQPRLRIAHLLDAFRELAESPRTSWMLAGWAGASIAARVAAATATAAAFGIESPLLAALVIVPALELAGLFPLTPGNIGIADSAVALALHTTGSHLTAAITSGIGLHAVETVASLGFGSCSLVYLTSQRVTWVRRLSRILVGAAAISAAALIGVLMWT